MQRPHKRAVVLGLSGLAAGALVVPAAAWATGGTPSPGASGSAAPSSAPARPGPGWHHGPGGPELVRTLASELGLSEQKVRDALDAVRGELRGVPPRRGQGGTPSAADRDARRAEFTKALAAKLGVTEEKLTAALDKARAAADADHAARLKARLDAAVQAGKITQADADAVMRVEKAGVLEPGR
ncbi:MAG TPA: hypothetical protein VGJ63_00360 [Micromonosporaceae bacterium]|jgi:hypothetical protein